jgi:hypothetical protein
MDDTPEGVSFIKGYDWKGAAVEDADSVSCVAKAVTNTSRGETYYLVKHSSGRTRRMFYDPATDHPDTLKGVDRMTNLPSFTFRRVRETAFQYYLNYLRTGRANLLSLAEREATASAAS